MTEFWEQFLAPAAAKKVAPATKAAPKPTAATPFSLDTKRSLVTKTAVSVMNLTHADAIIKRTCRGCPSPAVLCVDHGEMTTVKVRREAHKIGTNPKGSVALFDRRPC